MAKEVVQQKLEFRLINPTESGFLQKIDWNKEELEAAVRKKMEDYENVVYTEDTLGQAKNDRAELNKLIKAIEDRRKQVKNILNEPYKQFEAEVKEVVDLIQKPVALIDRQVKDFEDKEKSEKQEKLKETFTEAAGDLISVLTFEKVFDQKYLNKTFKLSDAQKEIREKVETVQRDLDTIDSLESKYKLNAKDVYISTLDLPKALAENKRLTDLEEKLEADNRRKAEEEAERQRLEEERRKEEEARKAEEESRKAEGAERIAKERAEHEAALKEADEKLAGVAQRNAIPEEEKTQPKKFKVKFEAKGTREQLEKLIAYMGDNGIEYGRI